jgi:hypothetical protein
MLRVCGRRLSPAALGVDPRDRGAEVLAGGEQRRTLDRQPAGPMRPGQAGDQRPE